MSSQDGRLDLTTGLKATERRCRGCGTFYSIREQVCTFCGKPPAARTIRVKRSRES